MDQRPLVQAPRAGSVLRLTRFRFGGLIVAALGAALAPGALKDATAARCRKKSAGCSRKEQCCSKRCKRGFCYPRRR